MEQQLQRKKKFSPQTQSNKAPQKQYKIYSSL